MSVADSTPARRWGWLGGPIRAAGGGGGPGRVDGWLAAWLAVIKTMIMPNTETRAQTSCQPRPSALERRTFAAVPHHRQLDRSAPDHDARASAVNTNSRDHALAGAPAPSLIVRSTMRERPEPSPNADRGGFRSRVRCGSGSIMLRCTKVPESDAATRHSADPCRAERALLLSHLHGPASVRVVLCPPLVRFALVLTCPWP